MRYATIAALLLAATQAEAVPVCGPRLALIGKLLTQHNETAQAVGLGSDGGIIEIFASPEGAWTILVTYPNRPTCAVANGKGWDMIVAVVGDPA